MYVIIINIFTIINIQSTVFIRCVIYFKLINFIKKQLKNSIFYKYFREHFLRFFNLLHAKNKYYHVINIENFSICNVKKI